MKKENTKMKSDLSTETPEELMERIEKDPFLNFCNYAGDVIEEELAKRKLTIFSACSTLEGQFDLSKQTAYNRILQMSKVTTFFKDHKAGRKAREFKEPNITLRNLCSILDVLGFQLQITIKPKNKK